MQHDNHGAPAVEECNHPARFAPGPIRYAYKPEDLLSLKPAKSTVSRPIRKLLFKFNIWHKLKSPKHKLKLTPPSPSLITIKPEYPIYKNPINNSKPNIKFCLINTRSIRGKSGAFINNILSSDIDICIITETWLKQNDNKIRAELTPNGYAFRDAPRLCRQGGGLALLCKRTYEPELIEAGERASFEYAEFTVSLNKQKTSVVAIYRPPYSTNHPVTTRTFFQEFPDFIEARLAANKPIIITGDFNIHIEDATSVDGQQLLDILGSFSLTNHVTFPTHLDNHTLDLIITRTAEARLISNCIPSDWFSDHRLVTAEIPLKKNNWQVKNIIFRETNKINIENLRNDIINSPLSLTSEQSPDTVAKLYHETLSAAIDKHAPEKTKTVVVRPDQPWFNAELASQKREVRKAERLWRKSGETKAQDSPIYTWFKETRKDYYDEVENAKCIYYKEKVRKCDGNQRKLYNLVKEISGESMENPLPPHDEMQTLVNGFSTFFMQKIDKIRNQIDTLTINTTPPPVTTSIPPPQLASFRQVSEAELSKLLRIMANKQCTLDPCPTYLVKECQNELLPCITRLINASLNDGVFPDEWKRAVVKPLIKKANLACVYSNYRPVSNLCFISKLCEKVVISQLQNHMDTHQLSLPLNSAYKALHSTETALLKVQTDIATSIGNGDVTLLVMLDLSAAFDTIDHQVLRETLVSDFGVTGKVLSWIMSYLSDRSQQVLIENVMSEPVKLKYGVPQGSCLGPILFTLYLSGLYKTIERHLPQVHGYADDNQLYLTFKPGEDSERVALEAMEACVHDVRSWMIHNKLKINDSKTEFIILGTKHSLSHVNASSITVGTASIEATDKVKNLGVYIDNILSHKANVSHITSKAHYQLHKLGKIRKALDTDTIQSLVHSLITSHLDYCNSLLIGTSAQNIHKLQLLQNAAARLIHWIPKQAHVTPLLKQLHWLPIPQRVIFKVLITTYKALHKLAPTYITELIRPYQPTRSLRSENQALLEVPRIRNSYHHRSFAHTAPRLWNDLPLNLRESKTLNIFKCSLKTHLYKHVYDI